MTSALVDLGDDGSEPSTCMKHPRTKLGFGNLDSVAEAKLKAVLDIIQSLARGPSPHAILPKIL